MTEIGGGAGRRLILDVLTDANVALESKVGRTGLTDITRAQILKDRWLIDNDLISGAHWHFFRSGIDGRIGPDPDLVQFLVDNAIPYTVHY